MPTQVRPASVETTVSWDRTGITGTLGVRVIDNVANTTPYGRNTAIVTEYPAGSGIYAAIIPDFASPGEYTIVWDDFLRWDAVPLTVTATGTTKFGAVAMTETLDITTSGIAINTGDWFSAASMTATLAITTTPLAGNAFDLPFDPPTPTLIGAFDDPSPAL